MTARTILTAAFCVMAAGTASAQTAPAARSQASILHLDDPTLSKPAYRVLFESNVRVPMRDGVTLASDIYRPDAPGKFPAILVRTPYNRATAGLTDEARWFAARGYVVVRQDVRGRYDSDGTFYAFKNEADDGYDADEWFGSQPWFNGNLGTMGGSYVGYTQWAQAIRGSKYLKAMIPYITTPDTATGSISTARRITVSTCPGAGSAWIAM